MIGAAEADVAGAERPAALAPELQRAQRGGRSWLPLLASPWLTWSPAQASPSSSRRSASSTICGLALGGVALAEGAAAVRRFRDRAAGYKAAAERAAATGRPLVVIGDPDAGLHTRLARAYGCGDVCVDLTGCAACPVGLAADITKGPIDLAADSAVVYVSCVLEYVGDVAAAVKEINRIAGSPDNVFIVTVHPWSLTARLYPGARWAGTATNDGGVVMRPVSNTEKVAIVGALATLALAAFWRR